MLGLWLGASAVLGTATWFTVATFTGPDAEAPTLTTVLLVYLLLPLAALVVYRPSGIRDRLAMTGTSWRTIGLAVLAWLTTMAALAIAYAVFGLVTGDAAAPLLDVLRDSTDYSRFAQAGPGDWILIVIRALILAGIAEELLFRGILFGWLRRGLPWWAVALITASLFAGIHYFPVLIPVGVVLGVLFVWLRERLGSILPGLILHWLTDWLLFAIALTLWLSHR
ncbi:CPBP family intramembrane glutamic endopeptidase [Acrocarpospora sp. B8E8]